jgi:hypothetical protein
MAVTRRVCTALVVCMLSIGSRAPSLSAEEPLPLSRLSGTWLGKYDYTGFFRREGEDVRLEFEGQNDPCPPRCLFLERYRVKKQDIEE